MYVCIVCMHMETLMVPFGIRKASPQEGNLWVRSSLGPLSDMHGVFSNGGLPCILGREGQPRATAVA